MARILSLVLAGLVSASPAIAQVVMQRQIFIPDQVPEGQPKEEKKEVQPDANTNPDPKSLAVSDEDLALARGFVSRLSSPVYRERDLASRELRKMGRLALVALKETLSQDVLPEVRLRTDILLPHAEADDMKSKVLCFLADKDGKYSHSLPGWKQFQKATGDDKSSRELFAEVLKNAEYHTLLLAVELPPEELGQLLMSHYREFQNRMNRPINGRYVNVQPKLQEVVVLSFLESEYSDKVLGMSNMWGYSVCNYFYSSPDIQNAMSGRGPSKYAEPLKKIITRWMETRETSFYIQQVMSFAQQWGLKDQLKYAAKMFDVTDANMQWAKAQAIQQIGMKKAKEYLPKMMKTLTDTTLLSNVIPGNHQVLLQDYALGVLIRLTEQDPKDYGVDLLNSGTADHVKFGQYNNYYFKDDDQLKADDKRKAAIEKFNTWAKTNLKAHSEPKEPMKDDNSPKPTPTPKSIPRKR